MRAGAYLGPHDHAFDDLPAAVDSQVFAQEQAEEAQKIAKDLVNSKVSEALKAENAARAAKLLKALQALETSEVVKALKAEEIEKVEYSAELSKLLEVADSEDLEDFMDLKGFGDYADKQNPIKTIVRSMKSTIRTIASYCNVYSKKTGVMTQLFILVRYYPNNDDLGRFYAAKKILQDCLKCFRESFSEKETKFDANSFISSTKSALEVALGETKFLIRWITEKRSPVVAINLCEEIIELKMLECQDLLKKLKKQDEEIANNKIVINNLGIENKNFINKNNKLAALLKKSDPEAYLEYTKEYADAEVRPTALNLTPLQVPAVRERELLEMERNKNQVNDLPDPADSGLRHRKP